MADDIAYVGSPDDIKSPDGIVYAFSTTDGSLRWLFVQNRPLFPLFTAVSDTVYMANGTNVDALDAATGALRWRFTESPPPDGTPVVVGETAYIVAVDGTLYAVT